MVQRKRMLHREYVKGLTNRHGLVLQEAHAADHPVWWANSCVLPAGCSAEQVRSLLIVCQVASCMQWL